MSDWFENPGLGVAKACIWPEYMRIDDIVARTK